MYFRHLAQVMYDRGGGVESECLVTHDTENSTRHGRQEWGEFLDIISYFFQLRQAAQDVVII